MLFLARTKSIVLSLKWWLILMPLIIIPLFSLNWFCPGCFTHLEDIIAQHRIIFTGFRWIILSILLITWPNLIKNWSYYKKWSQAKKNFWVQKRWKLLTWLVLFELLVNENWLFYWWKHN